jgi:hypothetical protein
MNYAPNNVTASVETITPDKAAEYLEHNVKNRTIKKRHLDKMIHDLEKGRWHMNGSSIVFDDAGILLDGQHRLNACVLTKEPMTVVVVRGVAKTAQQTIDNNISRSATDVAEFNGYANARKVTGIARLLLGIKNRAFFSQYNASTSEIMEFLRVHPHIVDSGLVAAGVKKTAPEILVGAWHYLAFYLGGQHEAATRAVTVLHTGIPTYENDPIHAFRERFIRERDVFTNAYQRRVHGLWTLNAMYNDHLAKEPIVLCKVRASEVRIVGVDYSKL